jgi:nicotinamidase-related amidase
MTAYVEPKRAALILIDVQPLFLDLMAGEREPLLARLEHLLALARWHEMPVLATFEHPVERNGWLPERLERIFPPDGGRFVKRTFNLCREPEIRAAVEALGREQLLVAGAETDVCVLQSTLGLLEMGRQVFLLEDCLFTAEPNDGPALRRMEQAGVIPLTYKTLHYELRGAVGGPRLIEEWNRRYGDGDGPFVDPYDLPVSRPAHAAKGAS